MSLDAGSCIEEVRISRFLSIREAALSLGKLTVLIGPNASGKSNVVKALRVVSLVASGKPLDELGFRGYRELVYLFEEDKEASIELRIRAFGRQLTYRLMLSAAGYIEEAEVDGSEALYRDSQNKGFRYLSRSGVKSRELDEPYMYFGRKVYLSALCRVPSDAARELKELARVVKGISAYSFTPDRIRSVSDVKAYPEVSYHGSNLARALLHIYLESRGSFNMIESAIRGLVPEVEEVKLHIEEGKACVELWLQIRGIPEPVKPPGISDGVLRLLAYVTVLHMGHSLVALEEPENLSLIHI